MVLLIPPRQSRIYHSEAKSARSPFRRVARPKGKLRIQFGPYLDKTHLGDGRIRRPKSTRYSFPNVNFWRASCVVVDKLHRLPPYDCRSACSPFAGKQCCFSCIWACSRISNCRHISGPFSSARPSIPRESATSACARTLTFDSSWANRGALNFVANVRIATVATSLMGAPGSGPRPLFAPALDTLYLATSQYTQ